jgi:lipopolysaccharide export system permease protein
MKIVQKFYMQEYLKLLGIIVFGLALIFSLLDLVDKIDNFTPGKISMVSIMNYIFLIMPKYIQYLLPMSLLLSSLFIFGLASRNKELIAIKASGGKLKGLFLPFIIMGFMFSLFSFVLGEFAVPDFSERLLEFKREYMTTAEKVTVVEGTIWLRGTDGSIVRIALYVPGKNLAKGVSIFMPGEESLRKRIEAEEAQWAEDQGGTGIWKLAHVVLYDFEGGKVYSLAEMAYPYLESPTLFSRGIRKPEEMGITELFRYMERLNASGIKDSKLLVDFHVKVSYPLMNFFMMVLGLALSGMSRTGGGLFASGVGISLSVVYWLLYTFMLSMGYARVIHPVLAPWIVPVLFGMIAAYLFRRIPE